LLCFAYNSVFLCYILLIHNICKKYYCQHGKIIADAVCKIKRCRWHASRKKKYNSIIFKYSISQNIYMLFIIRIIVYQYHFSLNAKEREEYLELLLDRFFG